MILLITIPEFIEVLSRILGLCLFSGVFVTIISIFYRWYTRNQIPEGVSILLGLGVVAIWINATSAIQLAIIEQNEMFTIQSSLITIGIFTGSTITSIIGRKIGDTISINFFAVAGAKKLNREVSEVVKTVGRVTTIEIPKEIKNIEGYDPVPQETKELLQGTTLIFPRRLTISDLRERFKERLKNDYGIGHVDVDITQEGEIKYLAVGSRAAGIGPTLPQGMSAIAINSDPAFSASPGDIVQVWSIGNEQAKRLVTGEIRGISEEVVTLAVNQEETKYLDDGTNYKLVTLPNEVQIEKELISILRSANETMGTIEISESSPLTGVTVGSLDINVVAILYQDGNIEPIPKRNTIIKPGSTVYIIARQEEIRKVEIASDKVKSS